MNRSPRRSALQRDILEVLYEDFIGGLRIGEISQIIERHQSSVSRAVKLLNEQGMVDRKGRYVCISDKGQKEVRKLRNSVKQSCFGQREELQRLQSPSSLPESSEPTTIPTDNVSRATDSFRNLELISTNFKRALWPQRELERLTQGLRGVMAQMNHISGPLTDTIASLDRITRQFTLPRSHLSSIQTIQSTLITAPIVESLSKLSSLELPQVHLFKQNHNQISQAIKNFSNLGIDTDRILRRTIVPTAPIEALLESQHLQRRTIETALQPQIAYQQFSLEHLRLALEKPKLPRINRLLLVDVGAELLTMMVRGFELGSLMTPSLPDSSDFDTPEVTVYQAIDDEVTRTLDFNDPKANIEYTVKSSIPARIVKLGACLVQLVHDLNGEFELEGGDPIFKPTTRTMLSCGTLTSHVARDRNSFYIVTDHLYFLLYEGSGAAKRLTGLTNDATLTPLWRVKHLRLSARHDIDHGGKREIAKKHKQIGEVFKALIGQVVPRTSLDWQRAQLALYGQIVLMLEQLWYRNEGFG